MAKETNFKVGDLVYFRKYEREVEEPVFRPGTAAEVVEVTELDGQEAYVIESKKGARGTVLADELKLKERPRLSKDLVRQAIASDADAPTGMEVEVLDSKEEARKASLLSGNAGDAHLLILTDPLQKVLEEEHQDPLQAAQQYWADANRSYFRLGGILAYIYLMDLYQNYQDAQGNHFTGRDAFNRFVDATIPNMKSRRARYFMEIYIRFTNLGVPEDVVVDLGWTLAANIAAVATQENVYELIQYAKDHGGNALKLYIKQVYHTKEGVEEEDILLRPAEVKKMKHVTVSLYEDQFEMLQQAFAHVENQYPEYKDNDSQKLAVIISEYMQNVYQEDSGSMTKEELIQYGEAKFADIELFARNRRTGEVLNPRYDYGQVQITVAPGAGQARAVQEVEAAVG